MVMSRHNVMIVQFHLIQFNLFIYQPVKVTKKSNTKQLENILAKWPTQGLKNRLRVASRI